MQPGDLSVILPEIILSLFAMAGLMVGAYGGKDKTAPMLVWTTSALMVVLAAWMVLVLLQGHGALTVDPPQLGRTDRALLWRQFADYLDAG